MPVEGYIIDYENQSGLYNIAFIKFLYYEDIEDSVEPTYDEQSVHGRSDSHIFYSNTGPNEYSFNLKLVASVDQGDDGDAKKIYNEWLWIKSFAYPDYGNNKAGPTRPPHKAIITIGKWFRKVGVIKSPGATYSKVHDDDGYPLIIECRFTFRVVRPRAPDLFDIRAGK